MIVHAMECWDLYRVQRCSVLTVGATRKVDIVVHDTSTFYLPDDVITELQEGVVAS